MAKRAQYDNVAIDVTGAALDGIEVTVRNAADTADATIYGSKAGGSISNPVVTPTTGLVQFWAEPGEYTLKWHDPEIPARISDRTTYFESVSGDTGGIDGGQLEDDAVTETKLADDSVGASQIISNAVQHSEIGSIPAFTVSRATQSIGTSITAIIFDTEVLDTMGAITPDASIELPLAGLWSIDASVWFIDNISDGVFSKVTLLAGGQQIAQDERVMGANGRSPSINISGNHKAALNDAVVVNVSHGYGSGRAVQGRLSAVWIGEG